MRAPAALTAAPDRRRRPSDGVVVEASILARLLRIRLLTLEATAVIVPADVTPLPSASLDVEARRSRRSASVLPARSGATGRGGLAEAVRIIGEGAAILAEARETGIATRIDARR
jgi:hypothetical protein